MAVFRVPYPDDPDRRQVLFQKAAEALGPHGSYEGTLESGSFQGATPIGGIAGTYRAINGSGELEVVLTKKPWILSTHRAEHEVRKFLTQA